MLNWDLPERGVRDTGICFVEHTIESYPDCMESLWPRHRRITLSFAGKWINVCVLRILTILCIIETLDGLKYMFVLSCHRIISATRSDTQSIRLPPYSSLIQ